MWAFIAQISIQQDLTRLSETAVGTGSTLIWERKWERNNEGEKGRNRTAEKVQILERCDHERDNKALAGDKYARMELLGFFL